MRTLNRLSVALGRDVGQLFAGRLGRLLGVAAKRSRGPGAHRASPVLLWRKTRFLSPRAERSGPVASVSQLGYLGIGTSDARAWQDLATAILGMQVVPGDDTSTTYLRMDEYHHRLELRANGGDALEFVG